MLFGPEKNDEQRRESMELGDRIRDKVSGLKGIAVARTDYLWGCAHWCIKPEGLHEGKPIPSQWFDEPQLEVVKSGVFQRDTKEQKRQGGPQPSPPTPSRATRSRPQR